jgi:hypothetical protein
MGCESGISLFACYIDCPLVLFKNNFHKDALRHGTGVFKGESPSYFGKFQKYSWKEETSYNIIHEAKSILNNIL